jgi:hypothetical protein
MALVSGGLVPLGQAVAAETRKVHQVDILDILAAVQVGDQSAKSGGFEFQALLIVHKVSLRQLQAASFKLQDVVCGGLAYRLKLKA